MPYTTVPEVQEQDCSQAKSITHLLDSSMAAPPTLKRQFGISMERSLPKYQFWVMFSVLTTNARLFGYTCNYAGLITSQASQFCPGC